MKKLCKSLRNQILSLGIVSLLIFIPLYPKFPLFQVPGTYVAIRAEDFLVLFVFLVWFWQEAKNKFPTFRNQVSRLILLYLLIGGLSTISALTITRLVKPHLVILYYLRHLEYMSLFWVAYAALKYKEKVKSYFLVLALAVIGVFVVGVGQKFFDWPVVSTMNEEFSKGLVLYLTEWTRINSTFAGHYDLAAFAVILMALITGFILAYRRKMTKLLLIIVALMIFYLLILTESRVSFVAYLLGIALVLLLTGKKWWIMPVVGLSIAVMVFGSELGQRYAATFDFDFSFLSGKISFIEKSLERLKKREKVPVQVSIIPTEALPQPTLAVGKTIPAVVETPVIEEQKEKVKVEVGEFPATESAAIASQRSGEIRFKVEWPRSIRAFLKNPLLGTGYSSVTLATDNDYLRALAETGLLGLGSFLLIFAQIGGQFLIFLKKSKNDWEKFVVAGMIGAVIGTMTNAFFIDIFEASKVAFIFWIWLGFMVKIMILSEEEVL